MSAADKERQRQRARAAQKHWKTHEQERQLAEARKARAHRRRKPEQIDPEETFVKMRRAERVIAPSPRKSDVPQDAETRATVIGLARGRAHVLTADGERAAVLAGPLAAAQQTEIAVGDDVVLHERPGADPLVARVLERRSELARPDPHNPHRRRVLAANVDLVVLVLSAERLRAGLIERLVQALAGSGAGLAVCINKIDVPHDARELEALLVGARSNGLPMLAVSARCGDGLDGLRALVRGRTCVFVGHSGTGKSTLLNRLDPDTARSTGAVRAADGKGRHTTAASRLTVLADGTRLIDTPGVRAFGLDDDALDAPVAFPDIAALAQHCRFRDCAHLHEPRCAVRGAVEAGVLPADRLAAFLRLFAKPP